MNTFSKFLIISGALCLGAAANAGTTTSASDASHITNGSTGYIGLTQSAGEPRSSYTRMWVASSQGVSGIPTGAGEASTMVGGRPNLDPNAPMRGSMSADRADLRAMGNSHSMAGEADVTTPAAY